MEDEEYERENINDYEEKHIQDKYGLLSIPLYKINEPTKHDHDDDLNKGILYGQLVGFKPIGKDCEETSKSVKYLSGIDQGDESSLAILYGVTLKYYDERLDLPKKEIDSTYPLAYLIREWVTGHGFSNNESLFEKDVHDRLVLLYRLCKQIEFLHLKCLPYIFLRPNKIIVTVDMDIKLMDFVKNDQWVLNKIRLNLKQRGGKLTDQMRFIYPEVFNENGYKLTGQLIEISEFKRKQEEIESQILGDNEEENRDQKQIQREKLYDFKCNENSESKEKEGTVLNKANDLNVFHTNFIKYRKYDLWSIGCHIYYAMKEEFPWVCCKDEKGETVNLKYASKVFEKFKLEMSKPLKDRKFFITDEDLKPDPLYGKHKIFELARKCLSGEIKSIEELLKGKSVPRDPKCKEEDENCFEKLSILKNYYVNGEVHYDFNAACAKMVYNIQELVNKYNRLEEKNIYEPNLISEIMKEI